MKKWKKHINFENGVISIIVLMIVCIIFSICFSDRMGQSTSSIIGGVLSAIATVFLGLIAIWQNTRYKKMADETNDVHIRPEFFVVYCSPNGEAYYNLPTLTIFPRRWHGDTREEILCFCKVLNYPISRMKPTKLIYSINNQTTDAYLEFDAQSEENLIIEKDGIFRIILKKYVQLCDVYIEIEFENIYGNKYTKIIEFIAPAEGEIPEASIFGTYKSGKILLQPAQRVDFMNSEEN